MKYVLLSILTLTSVQGFARIPFEKLNCEVNTFGSQRMKIQHVRTVTDTISYNGNELYVEFKDTGAQSLTLWLNGYSSEIYEPKESLYVLQAPNGVNIQCMVEE